MGDLFTALDEEIPARRLDARAARLLLADGAGFDTRDVDSLRLELDGIPGDRHFGPARGADSRVPWYPRGTPIRNSRQVSLVAADELSAIAARLGIAEVRPEWIGANMVIEGIGRLTRLPAGSRLHFGEGATLAVEGENAPCRHAGGAVAAHFPGREGLELDFVRAATGLRGLVAWVERAGDVAVGAEITVKVPVQRFWRG